jgi:hypothetical protein
VEFESAIKLRFEVDITNADWVSEFAPRSQSKFLSYIVGWLAALGWQALVATTGELEVFAN